MGRLNRHHFRRIILALTAAAVALLLFMIGPTTWRHIKTRELMMEHQRRCMVDPRPQGSIAYDDDPAHFSALLSSDQYRAARFARAPHGRDIVTQTVADWSEVTRPLRTENSRAGELIPSFLGGRSTRVRAPRLVAVDIENVTDTADEVMVHLATRSVAPVRLLWYPELTQRYYVLRAAGGAASRVCFRVGQADTVDPSRFTIAYTIAGREGELVGRLLDDGAVELKQVAGPGRLAPDRSTSSLAQH